VATRPAVEAGALLPSELIAPVQLVQIAIAILLRNAIEQSDAGTVRVSVEPPGVVRIEDPGHGLSPEEISRIYARMARTTGERYSRGIGLELIGRICEHLGWVLQMRSEGGKGTTMILDLRSAMTGRSVG
jgi:signal transduction histidine kinase